jgi:hypothetical protein
MMENLFEKCLYSRPVFGGQRKIKPEQLSEMAVTPWLSATKAVDPDSLKPINHVVNSARSYLSGVSLSPIRAWFSSKK